MQVAEFQGGWETEGLSCRSWGVETDEIYSPVEEITVFIP